MESGKISKFLKLDKVMDNITGYVETRLKIFKLEAKEEVSLGLAKMIQIVLLALFFIFFLLFASLALSFYFSSLLESFALGFLMVALLYAIIGSLIYVLSEKLGLQNKIYNYLDKHFKSIKDE